MLLFLSPFANTPAARTLFLVERRFLRKAAAACVAESGVIGTLFKFYYIFNNNLPCTWSCHNYSCIMLNLNCVCLTHLLHCLMMSRWHHHRSIMIIAHSFACIELRYLGCAMNHSWIVHRRFWIRRSRSLKTKQVKDHVLKFFKGDLSVAINVYLA